MQSANALKPLSHTSRTLCNLSDRSTFQSLFASFVQRNSNPGKRAPHVSTAAYVALLGQPATPATLPMHAVLRPGFISVTILLPAAQAHSVQHLLVFFSLCTRHPLHTNPQSSSSRMSLLLPCFTVLTATRTIRPNQYTWKQHSTHSSALSTPWYGGV